MEREGLGTEEGMSRPSTTGCLMRSMVRNLPVGSDRTITILKELVPMSTAAKRFDGFEELGRLVAIVSLAIGSWGAFASPQGLKKNESHRQCYRSHASQGEIIRFRHVLFRTETNRCYQKPMAMKHIL